MAAETCSAGVRRRPLESDPADLKIEVSQDQPSGSASSKFPARLLHFDELPAWRRDNAFIRAGYRPTSNSYVKSFRSIAGVHNESVNIWTHLGGALIAVALATCLYVELPAVKHLLGLDSEVASGAAGIPKPGSTSSLTLVHLCFAAGAFACLGMSATYHSLTNHSPAVNRWGNKLDYSGIVLLIVGSYMPALYYGLLCHPRWLTFYMYLINLLGLACLVVSWLEHFRTPQWRPYRAMLFIGLGASGVVPIAHGLFFLENHGDGVPDTLAIRYQRLNERMGLNWILLQGALYVFGAVLYACRFPERLAPGRFDIWGSSHQIFHVFVLLAASSHLRAILQAYAFHASDRGHCPVPPL